MRLLTLDVDGVLTDGRLLIGDDGVEYKAFHVHDGQGLKMLMASGIEVAVLSARRSKLVVDRMAELGVQHVHQGRSDKLPVLRGLLAELDLELQEVAYVGDDVVDLPIISRVGLGVAVADAHPAVRDRAHWCTRRCGGHGAVRELCDLLLEAQGRMQELLRRYLDDGGGETETR